MRYARPAIMTNNTNMSHLVSRSANECLYILFFIPQMVIIDLKLKACFLYAEIKPLRVFVAKLRKIFHSHKNFDVVTSERRGASFFMVYEA
jgi:hypothetical protein